MVVINLTAQRKQLHKLAINVLPQYGLKADSIRLIGESVNSVFQVVADGARYALRIHPSNNHSTEKIQAELLWLSALRTDTSLLVPEPVPTKDGALVKNVSSPKMPGMRQVVLFKWLDGENLWRNLTPTTLELAGSFIANLHHHVGKFKLPDEFSRQHVNWGELRRWLDEETPQPKTLTPEDCALCATTAKAVSERINKFIVDSDYGLVHLDLNPWNYLLHQGKIAAIDFDDCQYAPFLYDMAVPLSYLDKRQDYESLRDGFLRGYTNKRQLPLHYEAGLELFIVIRAFQMIDWILSWPNPSHHAFGPSFLANSLSQLKRCNFNDHQSVYAPDFVQGRANMNPDEVNTILYEWNATDAPWPQEKCIHHLFEAQAETTPERTALIHGDHQITYGDLFDDVKKLAATLVSLEVGPDIPVVLFLERSVETVIAIYSILRAGGFYVPIDTEWPVDRIRTILTDTNPPVLLTCTEHTNKIPQDYTGVVLRMDALPKPATTDLLPTHSPTPSSAVYCMYTSGTAGKPKGIIVEHQGLVKRIQWFQDQFPLTPNDRLLNKTPYGFGISEWEYFWALPHGATLIIATPHGHKDPEYIYSLMIKERITVCFFVPSMLTVLLKYMSLKGLDGSTFITHMFTCGEALMPNVCLQFFTEFDSRLINLYGPTEADMTYWECPRLDPGEMIDKVPIGKPMTNVKVYILDEHMQPVSIGVPGMLYFGGVATARGYLNRPALTNAKFISNPFAEGRLFKTGDLAKWLPDGNIEFLGRIDYQVKIRGFRIELEEIETAFASIRLFRKRSFWLEKTNQVTNAW